MKVIRCKNNKAFAMCSEDFIDPEWIKDEKFYESLGCKVSIEKNAKFEHCDCDHCKHLKKVILNR